MSSGALDPTNYKTFLQNYILTYSKRPYGFKNTGGRGLGQQDKSTLSTAIAANNFATIHALVLKNIDTYTTLDNYIMRNQQIGRSTLESPLCLALGDVNPQIILYLLGVLIYTNMIYKDKTGFINWRIYPNSCALDKDKKLEEMLDLKFDEIVGVIQSVEPEWTPKMYGGRKTRHNRSKRQKARRQTRRRG